MTRRAAFLLASAITTTVHAEQMQVGFLWHMHQPTYYPGENIIQTEAAHHFSYSIVDIHNQRFGPYTTWPRDAIQAGLNLPNLGAQVSFSGSLMENLNVLQANNVNGGMWNNWTAGYKQARAWNTQQNNPRLDLVGFGYEHPLMPLLDTRDMRMQIQLHRVMTQQTFGSNVPYSTGFFPAETAFSERMIPALVAEGMQWTLVDNIHFDRATKNYPHTNASGLYAPNKADQINSDPAANGGAWLQLNNLWAPSKVSAPFSYRPHNVQYIDPNSGTTNKIVAVPGARYEGNEDGRGGFGALQYQQVMDQYRQYNTDPSHPMFVMLHHDGDNYGGGSDAYYHNNFNSMVNWATGNPNYNVTTVADYLKRFPVTQSDVIHVENGSWAGADNGDAEFKKWLGDPNASGWSPDRNSWAVLTAAKNRVFTADDISPFTSHNNIINNSGSATDRAWHYLVQGEASDHWYWDGTEVWDSNVTRASNLAVTQANQVLTPSALANEHTPPSVFVPQRDSYNPGAFEFGTNPEPSDFKVWTFAYDVSGLSSVTLKWRADNDGENPLASTQNETYAGGSEVGAWNSASMTGSNLPPPPGNILQAQYRAQQFAAMVTGQTNKLIDYYVEAIDSKGNVTRSDIQHVRVGNNTTTGGSGFTMDGQLDSVATQIASNNGMKLHFAMRGGKLYVATNGAGAGNDHFIYLARAPGSMVAANWAKAGQIAQWDAYLADENDNGWSGWFDASGAVQNATGHNGGVLEGVIDLTADLGSIPDELYLAVGVYGTANGAALLSNYQVPASLDGDGNIQAGEYFRLVLPRGFATSGSGDWNTAWNWFDPVPNAIGAHARFLSSVNAPTTVYVDQPTTVGQMTFDNLNAFTVGGTNTLAIDSTTSSGTISVVSGNHTISAPLAMNDDLLVNVQRSQDTLTVSNLLGNTKTLTKQGPGTMAVNTLRTGGVTVASGTLRVLSNGTSSSASRVGTLDTGAGTLDLADNDMIVTAGSYNAVTAAIANARHGGEWDRPGLSSSAAVATFPRITTLGVLTGTQYKSINGASATFDNFGVANSDVLIKYTYYGDTDFNGIVDGADYARIDSTFNNELSQGDISGWFNGDLDYNNKIDGADYALIDSAFNAQAGTLLRMLQFLDGTDRDRSDMNTPGLRMALAHFDQFGESYAIAALTSVPEPVGTLGIFATTAMIRRRRRPRS